MEDTVELLNMIVKTCHMGHNTLLQLVDITKNAPFKQCINIQLKAYDMVMNEANVIYNQKGLNPPKQSKLATMSIFLNIKFSTLADKSTRHIADMLLQGTNMGIIEIEKALKDYPNADDEVLSICEKLQHMQQNNIKELKEYL